MVMKMKKILNRKKMTMAFFGCLFAVLTFTVLIGITEMDNESNAITMDQNSNIDYETNSESHLASASTADVLVVNHNQFKDYLSRNGFTYDTISASQFSSISANTINAYEIIILEPNWGNYEYLRSGVSRIKSYATSNTIVGIRVAGNLGSQDNIDMYSTDYDRIYVHQYADFYTSQHPFISGNGFGGHNLNEAYFDSWGSTDHGYLYNYPSDATYFEKILHNNHGCSMFEYQYSPNLYVVVDTLTSIDGPWGGGNEYVADNYIKFLNYRLTTRGSSGDTTAPSINHPSDIVYSEGTDGHSITWSVSDSNPDTYTIKRDATTIESGSWNNGNLEINVDGLTIGSYTYTLEVQDDYGNSVSDSVVVSVEDNESPSINSPDDLEYHEDSTSNTIAWSVSDAHADTYSLWMGEELVSSGSWSNGILDFNIDGLTKGTYYYTLVVKDESENSASDTVKVTIVDATNPEISNPSDLEHNESSVGNEIVWQITDKYPNNYTINRNGNIIESGSWESGELKMSTDELPMGTYSYSLTIYDMSKNSATDTVQVVIVDEQAPLMSTPNDLEYAEDSFDNIVTWTISDNHPDRYILYWGETEIESGSWINGDYEFNVDGLSLGVYDFTLEITDTSGNTQEDTVVVQVIDETDPIINSPADIEYQEGSTGNLIRWEGSDKHPQAYKLYFDNELIESTTWEGGDLELNIDGLMKGSYNYTLDLIDVAGNSVQDMVKITVVDQTAPVLTLLDDMTINETTETEISWMGSDLYPANYQIFRDGQIVDAGSWTNDAAITAELVNLTMGVYNYEIMINDSDGYATSDSVVVTVLDEELPRLESLDNIICNSFNANETIVWEVFDRHPSSYEIKFDGQIIDSGDWNGTEISVELNNLDAGTHTMNLTLVDESGNIESDSLTITVPEMEENDSGNEQSDEVDPNKMDAQGYFMIAGFGILILAGFIYSKIKK